MMKYKKYFGIIFIMGLIIGLILVVFINGSDNPSSIKSEVPQKNEGKVAETTAAISEPEVEPIPNASAKVINVKEHGAKGDGVTDDTKAFQNAIDSASKSNLSLLIPKSSKAYLIKSSLELKSNTHILGYDATLFMPSSENIQNIFTASSKQPISNISIKGLTLLSNNDQEGTGEYEGSQTSYVQGIYLFGINRLVINDVQMKNMYIGIKLDALKSGVKSENIIIDNLKIVSSRTPLFITSTVKLKMTNSVLDASGGATKFLHSAYIRGDTKDIEFNQVKFVNSPGGGVHIYNSNEDMSPPQNIRVIDCTIENTKVGIYIYSGAKDITITNLIMKNIELPFKINSAERVNIVKVKITNNPKVIQPIGLLNVDRISESKIEQVSLDGVGMTGYLFDIGSHVEDLTISKVKVSHLNNVGLLNGTSESIQNLIIENSVFEWNSIEAPILRFSESDSDALLRDNHFINSGKKSNLSVFKMANPNFILESNFYTGF